MPIHSETFRLGDSGDGVRQLQQSLMQHGFNPGTIDTMYGQGTVAAVMAFRNSEGLLHDGVTSQRTVYALGLPNSNDLLSPVEGVAVEVVSQIFPVTPIGNIIARATTPWLPIGWR